MNEFKLLLLLLLINHISAIKHKLRDQEKQSIKFEIGSTVEYDFQRKYFQFYYSGSSDTIYFSFTTRNIDIHLINDKNNEVPLEGGGNMYKIHSFNYTTNLTYAGTYFLEINCKDINCFFGSTFNSFIPGKNIETIDLSKNVYFTKLDFETNINHEMSTYKVRGLKENKFIFFHELIQYYNYYYPYYPDEPNPYNHNDYGYCPNYEEEKHKNQTIFEVCDGDNKCTKHVKFYKFEAGNEYTIRIHYFKYYCKNTYDSYYPEYFQPKISFFPITDKNFKTLNTEDLGVLTIETPIFYILNKHPQKAMTIMRSDLEKETISMFYSESNEIIDLNNLSLLANLQFQQTRKIEIKETNENNIIIFAFPSNFESKEKLYLVNENEEGHKVSFNIPANSTKIFYSFDKGDKEFYILTFNSEKKNIKFSFSDSDEGTDIIVQNYFPLQLYAKKDNSSYTINGEKYLIKYAIFGAVDQFYQNSFYTFGKKYLKNILGINLDNYLTLSQQNFRINTKYLPFFENYNAYLNGIDIKLNFYFRQLYGWSDIYECDPDGVNLKNLTKLTKPISNIKCKNKKSLINRLFNFSGEKIVSGYLSPDSYFDIYVEIDKNTDVIEINPILIDYIKVDSTAKYLKKGITYKLNFQASHLIKLEPGFKANILITNGRITAKINPKNPTIDIAGSNFTIKSDIDAMVYFFGKLPIQLATQVKIENKPGKYIKFSNVKDLLIIDFGFEGYLPSTYPLNFQVRENNTLYLDNLYEKMKRPLVMDEYLYAYYFTDSKNKNLRIEYLSNNLNIKNNDFNIYLIPKNDNLKQPGNTLIINAYDYSEIVNSIKFCKKDTEINLIIITKYENNKKIKATNENYNELKWFRLFRGDNKLTFTSNHPFVFSYSFYDEVDDIIYDDGNEEFFDERVVLTNLTIMEAKSKNNNDNKINITFNANYKSSTTRYIIIIAQANANNTIESFNDFCYIAELLNQRPKGVKVDYIYEASEKNDTVVNAEVDISSITELGKVQNYLINIISQELRFEKQINLYTPIEFKHTGKEKSKEDYEGGEPSGGEGDDSYPDDEGGNTPQKKEDDDSSSKTSLAFAIVTPILGVIIIILVIMVILAHKRTSSSHSAEEIEKLT